MFVFDGLVDSAEDQPLLRRRCHRPRSRAPRLRGPKARNSGTGCARCRSRICRASRCGRRPRRRSPDCGPASVTSRIASTPTTRPIGDTLLTHVDALPQARELTALWFVCERWDTEWGGETLFYDDAGDAEIAVSPKPGRLLLFDGAIRHAGKPPNRNCHDCALHLRGKAADAVTSRGSS